MLQYTSEPHQYINISYFDFTKLFLVHTIYASFIETIFTYHQGANYFRNSRFTLRYTKSMKLYFMHDLSINLSSEFVAFLLINFHSNWTCIQHDNNFHYFCFASFRFDKVFNSEKSNDEIRTTSTRTLWISNYRIQHFLCRSK